MLMRISNAAMKGKLTNRLILFQRRMCNTKTSLLFEYSVVEFASLSDMKTAIEKLDDTELNGRRVRLVEDRRGGRSGTCYFHHSFYFFSLHFHAINFIDE